MENPPVAAHAAAHGRPGDTIRFYDIDPLVVKVAARDFSFLALSKASIDIVMGEVDR